ncbi:unnamed protein product, partial [Larinioides sclopetarius]
MASSEDTKILEMAVWKWTKSYATVESTPSEESTLCTTDSILLLYFYIVQKKKTFYVMRVP